MPPKGTDGTAYPAQQKASRSVQDFNDIFGFRADALYGFDTAEGDFWALPNDAVPLTRKKEAAEPEAAQPLKAQPAKEEPKAPLSAYTLAPHLFALLADLGDGVFGVIKVALRRLLFIPRFFGAVFSWAFRELRTRADKVLAERKKRVRAERGMLRRELKGIRPYLKKAEGDPRAWFRRLGIVTRKLRENHRASFLRAVNVVLPVAAAAVLFLVINHWNNQTFALQVDYRQEPIGYIRSEEVFAEAEKLALQRIVRTDGGANELEKPDYRLASVPVNRLIDSLTLSDKLVEDSGEPAVGIYINKQFLCSVKNRSDAESVFDKMLAPYRTNKPGVFVDFVEDIRYEEGYYPDDLKTMWDASQLAKKLTEKKQTERKYKVKSGDTFWTIAAANDTTVDELYRLNPKEKKAGIWPGDELILSASVNYVQVKVMKTETRTVEIPFETIYTPDPSGFKGVNKTLSAGAKGKEKVTEMVTYLDGQKVSTKELSRERLSEPVSARVSQGTKSWVAPSTPDVKISVGSSGLVWPAPSCHSVSGGYGLRFQGRSFHTGVDLIRYGGATYGTLVVASMDGTVEFAGWSGSYGNRIVINHGGGIKTTYSHLVSGSMSVYPGKYVTAGTPIGRVGSTGWSSGAHLHFEISVNGSYRNPMAYLR